MILEHIGLTVSDLNRSIEFYQHVLGFTVLRKTTTNAYLHLDDQLLELTQCRAPADVSLPDTDADWTERMYCKVGVTHLGFCVDDLDEAVEAMKRLGCELITPPFEFEPHIEYAAEPSQEKLRRATRPVGKTYWKLAMLSDPDGIILELVER
ncbi:MAG TPA: VOC family protein [Anaerolineae bacterium]|nr:VOC family protein [Anaerolineae bacterium]